MGLIKIPETSLDFFKRNLDEIFSSGQLAEGPWNKKLSEFSQAYCKCKYAIPTASNGSGLLALLQACRKMWNRSKVLIQSNTMYGVKTLVNSSGLELVGLIDCNPSTLMPGLSHIKEEVTGIPERSRLIILLSHIGGIINPEIEDIAGFCQDNNIILLEDCAHSFGATYRNRHSGLFGSGGVYSFYATKAVPAGEGGMVVTDSDDLGPFIQDYVIYDRFKQLLDIGVNFRQSELQALLVYAVVKEVNSILEDKKKIAARYMETCDKLFIPYIPQEDSQNMGNYYKFIVLSKDGVISQELPELQTTTSKVYDYCLGRTKVITTNHACLPIWYGQSEQLTEKVIMELKACKIK
jgi:perosamine synthetase